MTVELRGIVILGDHPFERSTERRRQWTWAEPRTAEKSAEAGRWCTFG